MRRNWVRKLGLRHCARKPDDQKTRAPLTPLISTTSLRLSHLRGGHKWAGTCRCEHAQLMTREVRPRGLGTERCRPPPDDPTKRAPPLFSSAGWRELVRPSRGGSDGRCADDNAHGLERWETNAILQSRRARRPLEALIQGVREVQRGTSKPLRPLALFVRDPQGGVNGRLPAPLCARCT